MRSRRGGAGRFDGDARERTSGGLGVGAFEGPIPRARSTCTTRVTRRDVKCGADDRRGSFSPFLPYPSSDRPVDHRSLVFRDESPRLAVRTSDDLNVYFAARCPLAMASPGVAPSPRDAPFGRVAARAATATVGDHQHEVEATVRHFQELSAREDVSGSAPRNEQSNPSRRPPSSPRASPSLTRDDQNRSVARRRAGRRSNASGTRRSPRSAASATASRATCATATSTRWRICAQPWRLR